MTKTNIESKEELIKDLQVHLSNQSKAPIKELSDLNTETLNYLLNFAKEIIKLHGNFAIYCNVNLQGDYSLSTIDVSSERYIIDDSTVIAQIDIDVDQRYRRRTFNMYTYNENFDLSKDKRKQIRKLQKLTAKYAAKMYESENY